MLAGAVAGDHELGVLAPFPVDHQRDLRRSPVHGGRHDLLDQQADDSLLQPHIGGGLGPHAREVRAELQEAGAIG
jgi:hypothetical protein